MDERARRRIKIESEAIRYEIRGGTLYGQPLDESDVDMLIVAAYNAGTLLAGGKLVFELPASLKDLAAKDLPEESTELPEMSMHNAGDSHCQAWTWLRLTVRSGSGKE